MVKKPNNSLFQKLIRPLVFVVSLVILFIAFEQTPILGDGPEVASAQSACSQYIVPNRICNQAAYNDCGPVQYDGNRAFYECRASQNPTSCVGRIYCQPEDRPFSGTNPSGVGVDPQNQPTMKPTCDAVNKVSTFNTTTYDTCRDNLGNTGGNLCTRGASQFECWASQNDQCRSGMVYGCPAGGNNQPGNTGSGGPQVVNCPTGTSPSQQGQNTIVCVANQNTNGNANANSNNNNIANNNTSGSISTSAAQGGAAYAQGGAGGYANVVVNGLGTSNNNGGNQVIRVVLASGNTGVGTSAGQVIQYKGMQQLPATGLPALAWTAIGLVPAGFGLKRFRQIKKDAESNADYIWEDKKFKSIDN